MYNNNNNKIKKKREKNIRTIYRNYHPGIIINISNNNWNINWNLKNFVAHTAEHQEDKCQAGSIPMVVPQQQKYKQKIYCIAALPNI